MKLVIVLAMAGVAFAQNAPPDLRGIWRAENKADASLERAHVIVDPADGKIPYRPDAPGRPKAVDPQTRCFQPGVPRAAYVGTPFQIFQNARAVYIVYQDVHAYRIIYLDSAVHNDGLPYAMGDSRGHWEGNTLVADVSSFSDSTWLDGAGNYHSDALHIVERYTRMDRNTLLYEATIEDPKVFTKPWTIRMPLRLQTGAGAQIVEDECVEDETSGVRHHVSPFKAWK
ncbi:MAG TPA: hypothetical protein VFW44_17290 [Bryobacteraceae bacterium]|nr:hypothetical protein [Bryobacteraceae bacterium]